MILFCQFIGVKMKPMEFLIKTAAFLPQNCRSFTSKLPEFCIEKAAFLKRDSNGLIFSWLREWVMTVGGRSGE